MTTAMRTGAVLVFDGDCGFCTQAARWLEGRLTTPIAVVPWRTSG